MSKRQKKKAPVVEEVPQAEAETKTEYIYGDTQCVSGVEPEYQWGMSIDSSPVERCLIWDWKRNPSTPTSKDQHS